MERSIRFITSIAALSVPTLTCEANELSASDLTFFENEIRPLLVDNCYKCHSVDSKKIRGGFLIDSKPGMLRGGDSGPAIHPGNAADSRLIQMVQRHPDFESMPPKSKLNEEQIDTLISWIERGAPDPRLEEPEGDAIVSDFDLEERKQWWSLQPVQKVSPPEVEQTDWPSNAYDQFILSKLEEKDWKPAVPAERRALLRRLSFDLIGLRPTQQEIESFLSDDSPDAYETQVNRLLASPHFGEKWARHWMDIVRYAETKSFEADYTMPYTYRYRDYLIRAFNNDVPYDQFVKEALAGDLLDSPRYDPLTGDNESVKGPGFIYLTDGQHGPPDIHEDEARVFDGMINVTSKAFLGSTVACARCHDHKFDAITTEDYYSFYGMLRSSRLAHINTVPEKIQAEKVSKLEPKKKAIRSLVFEAAQPDVDKIEQYLSAHREIIGTPEISNAFRELNEIPDNKNNSGARREKQNQLDKLIRSHSIALATKNSLDPNTLSNWVNLAGSVENLKRWPELAHALDSNRKPQKEKSEISQTFAAVAKSMDEWIPQGLAFLDQPKSPGTLVLSSSGSNAVQTIIGSQPISGQYASRVSGAIRSPDFVIDGKPIEFQAKGQFASARLVVRNYELTGRGPTTAQLYVPLNSNDWQTYQMETYLWEGEIAYFEVSQNGVATHSVKPKEDPPAHDDNAYASFRFDPGTNWNLYWGNRIRKTGSNNRDDAIAATIRQAFKSTKKGKPSNIEADLIAACLGSGILNADTSRSEKLGKALKSYRSIAREIPEPRYARSLVDGMPHAEPVYIRGSHKNLSSEGVARRFLDGLGGEPIKDEGSGRLGWALNVVNPENPLTARVMVNRLWKHLFGTGIVATPNDFGHMGFAPSHPELLDYLANDFVRNGWSIKTMIRNMVLTSAYQMSSKPSDTAHSEDPSNKLLQHMPVKRLNAEAIRDHILACSGELDPTLFGASISAYVEDHPDSRAKPDPGPVDGEGRRSIYLEMRRSFLPTFLRAFDLPNATESTGLRQVTNVPAQSLALMNDPFVHLQSKAWAEKILKAEHSFDKRIDQIHIEAFGRPASDEEKDWSFRFIESLNNEYGPSADEINPWVDLCHMMYNRKEFIYVF